MRENYRNSIASIKKFPQFTTMHVIDGQAGLIICASLIFYSLTIDNILNTVVALAIALSGFKFMKGYETRGELTGLQTFGYFTVQSNVFMAIVSLAFAIKEIQLLKGRITKIPFKYYILKMIAVTAIGLTFFVVFIIFSILLKNGVLSLIRNSNLFFHCIIPVTSIINFIFFEKTDTIKLKYTFFGLIPTILYEMYYTSNVLLNMKDGKVSPSHDWYYFAQNGLLIAISIPFMILGITYIIALIIWKFNKSSN